mmetsp:Transcript_6805/g.11464  ORF Transcript_6805/g.11464 Transcript_6805/m.11464 type:complete len:167 (-) Transcript_6805:83-583(-)
MDLIMGQLRSFSYQVSQKWKSSNLSAILSPVFPHCAFPNSQHSEMGYMIDYTTIWNAIGFPSGTFPVTRVTAQEQGFRDHFGDLWTATINKSAECSEDMPISLQLVGHSYEDELVLGVMKRLSAHIDFQIEIPKSLPEILKKLVTQSKQRDKEKRGNFEDAAGSRA